MNSNEHNDDLMPEADFSNSFRGKHYQAYRQGHSVTLHRKEIKLDAARIQELAQIEIESNCTIGAGGGIPIKPEEFDKF